MQERINDLLENESLSFRNISVEKKEKEFASGENYDNLWCIWNMMTFLIKS